MRFSPISGTTSASVPIAAILTNAGSQARLPRPGAQRLHQLQRDADAGEVLVGIGAVVALRVHHRARVRQLVVRFVMVGDDQIDAELARAARRFGARMPQSTETISLHAFGMQAIDGAGCSP